MSKTGMTGPSIIESRKKNHYGCQYGACYRCRHYTKTTKNKGDCALRNRNINWRAGYKCPMFNVDLEQLNKNLMK